ncbi:uncharacterized protein LOC122060141 [Macadamia integrifolia]|uniref:uncharacterized protein LOC122060141 n=1 Tax=Macadamia integrifolia TaxID=60698 RepID=UPI001C53018C|nr:uncharacterized protein LOC122060141 [Macadamia integrifolia]
MTYDWGQCRNHYRIWKARLKSLVDLQKNSGVGWNDHEKRFDVPQHMWNEFKKKEQRFWKEHKVLPIHLQLVEWLRNEIATRAGSSHPSDAVNEDQPYNPVPIDEEIRLDNYDAIDDNVGESAHYTPNASSSRSRGRPSSGVTSKEKKKKGGAEKVSSPLKVIANAIVEMAKQDPRKEFAKNLCIEIDALPGVEFDKKLRAKQFFMQHKELPPIFLNANEADKPKVFEHYMKNIEDGGQD